MKWRRLAQRSFVFVTLGGCLCSAALSALVTQASHQQVASSAPSSSTGIITGRAINDEGQPLPHVEVYAIAAGDRPFVRERTSTDEQGRFRFTGLFAGSYLFNAKVPGYVSSQFIASDGHERVYYHLGDTVTLRMIKGGVITGRVTDASGEVITGLAVRVWHVHDTVGKLLVPSGLIADGLTDDRGIYRIYGLLPGSYLVGTTNQSVRFYNSVIGSSLANYSPGSSPRVGQSPTYHPSSTSDTAAEVLVRSGEEVSGIDIRFRGERGFSVSGKVADAAPADSASLEKAQIVLYNLATRAAEMGAAIEPTSGKLAFALYGVPDGEYELVALGTLSNKDEIASLPRRVSVKGADVTGLELTLTALSSISGHISLESGEARPGCEIKRPVRLEEVTLTARLAEKENREASVSNWHRSKTQAAPDNKGDFTLRNLTPAHYRLETNLPGEHWYVKTITAPNPAAPRQRLGVGRQGFSLKLGEKAKDLVVTIAEGAASVRGRVMPTGDGAKLPARLRVHLIPAEQTAADDVLRYAQTIARNDGSFTFLNLAPGKYWLLPQPIADDEPLENIDRPVAWNNAERARLRREAESLKVEIELQACQRVNDYALRYVSPGK